MYFAYVLKNTATGRLYKGHTDRLDERLKEHNSGKTKTTRHGAGCWKHFYHEGFSTRMAAVKRERYFKSAAGRRYLKSKGVKAGL